VGVWLQPCARRESANPGAGRRADCVESPWFSSRYRYYRACRAYCRNEATRYRVDSIALESATRRSPACFRLKPHTDAFTRSTQRDQLELLPCPRHAWHPVYRSYCASPRTGEGWPDSCITLVIRVRWISKTRSYSGVGSCRVFPDRIDDQ
jgi:hypothetical protein